MTWLFSAPTVLSPSAECLVFLVVSPAAAAAATAGPTPLTTVPCCGAEQPRLVRHMDGWGEGEGGDLCEALTQCALTSLVNVFDFLACEHCTVSHSHSVMLQIVRGDFVHKDL